MKLAILFIAFSMFSGNIFAETVIKGEEARIIYEQLNAFEYSSGAITAGLEIHITVRHDNIISCEKEVTKYANAEEEIEYTCTQL